MAGQFHSTEGGVNMQLVCVVCVCVCVCVCVLGGRGVFGIDAFFAVGHVGSTGCSPKIILSLVFLGRGE